MRLVVADTGPILHLGEAGILDLLSHTGHVTIPPRVSVEVESFTTGSALPTWIVMQPLDEPYQTEALHWQQAGLLHAGEAEAIALARQLSADWLLTDDTAARLFAQQQGLEVHGSLGVLLWAAEYRIIDKPAAESAFDKLAQSSLWLSSKALAHARTLLGKIFPTP